jgi:hypothetical protein
MLASFGRSGTSSLRLALETIGFRPLHGADVLTDPALVDAVAHRDVMALVNLTEEGGYDIALEMHRSVVKTWSVWGWTVKGG